MMWIGVVLCGASLFGASFATKVSMAFHPRFVTHQKYQVPSTNRATRNSVCHRWIASVRTLYILYDGMVCDAERSCERCHFCWFVDLLRRIGRILILTAASRNLCRWFDPPSRIAHPDISSRIGKDPANHFRRAYNSTHTNCRTGQAPTP